METVSAPVNGEHMNETVFLTSAAGPETVRVSVREAPWRHVALLTDGLEFMALTMPAAIPHEPFFRPLFRYLDETEGEEAEGGLREFLSSRRVRERSDDDITLLLAGMLETPAPPGPVAETPAVDADPARSEVMPRAAGGSLLRAFANLLQRWERHHA
jgi:hypothetical protein